MIKISLLCNEFDMYVYVAESLHGSSLVAQSLLFICYQTCIIGGSVAALKA